MGDHPVRVAHNVIKTYGYARFMLLIQMFRDGVPGPKIATEFEVTRQRVNQWKHAFGRERITYVLNAEIEELLGAPTSTRTTV